VVSPVYEALPAVYLHAMAYDNLLTLENNYKRAENTAFSWRVNGVVLFIIVCILLFPERIIRWLTARSREIFVLDLIGFHQRLYVVVADRRLPNPLRRWLPLGIAAIWAALPLLIGRLWNPSGHKWNGFVWASVLGVSLLAGMFALPYLHAYRTQEPDEARREFHEQLATLVGPFLLGVVFLIFYNIFSELEAALLLSLGFYFFFYKLFFVKDQLFVVTIILLVIVSLISFWPLDLGPRNIIAYVFFFEVARHLIKHAGEVAEKYRRLQERNPNTDDQWPWWAREWRFHPLKVLCELCDWEAKDEHEHDRATTGSTHRRVGHRG
jgi:hypothetical protein